MDVAAMPPETATPAAKVVAPFLKATVPQLGAVVALTVAVNATEVPYIEWLGVVDVTTVVVVKRRLKVTVTVTAAPRSEIVQVSDELVQPELMVGALTSVPGVGLIDHPATIEPAVGVAVRTMPDSLSSKCAEHVTPQLMLSPVFVEIELVTVPVPVPFFITPTDLLSVNVVAAVAVADVAKT